MDPFTALGIAANIFQVVQLSCEMLAKVKEFRQAGTTTDLHNQLELAQSQLDYAQRLKLLYEALQKSSRAVESAPEGPSRVCDLSSQPGIDLTNPYIGADSALGHLFRRNHSDISDRVQGPSLGR